MCNARRGALDATSGIGVRMGRGAARSFRGRPYVAIGCVEGVRRSANVVSVLLYRLATRQDRTIPFLSSPSENCEPRT